MSTSRPADARVGPQDRASSGLASTASQASERALVEAMEAWMSETGLGRALEFMTDPQDVEVLRSGLWVRASMIGWRREEGRSCRVMVRLSEGGAEKTAWADLDDVRLPEDIPGTESLPFLPKLPTGPIGQPASWWPSSDAADDPLEVAPTRLLELRRRTG